MPLRACPEQWRSDASQGVYLPRSRRVKWLVDVPRSTAGDETGETVALATILTMVKKLRQE